MEIGAALVVAAVEILDRRDAHLRGGGAHRVGEVPADARRLDAPFAAGRVVRTVAEEVIFVALEEWQHVLPRPAGKPELAPVVVIRRLPAHVDHRVDGGRAADHLAARIVQAPPIEAFLGLRAEHPVRTRIADREEIADRNVEPDPVIAAARFEQQHARSRIGREAAGEHAAGRTRAHHDVVVFAFAATRLGHGFPFADCEAAARTRQLPATLCLPRGGLLGCNHCDPRGAARALPKLGTTVPERSPHP